MLKDVADGVLAGRFDGSGAACGAEQGFDGVVHGFVAPVAHDLAVAGVAEAGAGEGGFEAARGRQGVRGVVGGLAGRDEGAHRLVHDGALGAFGRGEQAGHYAAARTGDAGRLAQRFLRLAGELERVDAGHRVERGVWVGKRFQVAFAQVSVGQPADDARHTDWVHRRTGALAAAHGAGVYLGDTDFTRRQDRFLSDDAYRRLAAIQAERDASGRFASYLTRDPEGLNVHS